MTSPERRPAGGDLLRRNGPATGDDPSLPLGPPGDDELEYAEDTSEIADMFSDLDVASEPQADDDPGDPPATEQRGGHP